MLPFARARLSLAIGAVLAFSTVTPAPVLAADPPYEKALLRLAEVLGSVHYLRNLCGEEGDAWRERMQTLIETENPEPLRRARLIASFNRGYRAFAAVHRNCTPNAIAALGGYMQEGAALSADITNRYGN